MMKWYFLAHGEDRGRMQSRVMGIVDHLLLSMSSFSMTTMDGRQFYSFVVEGDEGQAIRIESLLRKIYGILSVEVIPEADTLQRIIALLRVRCNISDHDEVLHFINALNAVSAFNARELMICPLSEPRDSCATLTISLAQKIEQSK
jgi:acetolactate synthase small subunit